MNKVLNVHVQVSALSDPRSSLFVSLKKPHNAVSTKTTPPDQQPVQCSQDLSVPWKFANLRTGQQQVECSRNFINGTCEEIHYIHVLYLIQWS